MQRFFHTGRSSVCLPLQLSVERLAGWEYSVAVFIALNLAAFLFILAAYIAIILTVSKSQRRVKAHGESQTKSTSLKRESTLARRVLAIILTDFSCWVPVIILSILALIEKFYDPDGKVYVWFVAFVLPVNSAVNPVLYTFSTPKVGIKQPISCMRLSAIGIDRPLFKSNAALVTNAVIQGDYLSILVTECADEVNPQNPQGL